MNNQSGVTVEGLRKIYPSSAGVAGGIHEADFHLPPGTFFTLLGPSGCGKTTTLRCIAGLEHPDSGRVQVDDRVFFDQRKGIWVPLNRRNIGMVFQSYAIWPHMSVFENVSFPLRVAKDRSYSREEISSMTMKALSTVALESFAERSATQLSGGQQQRVALARAIVREPSLLLLDEPLSNLDAALRDNMRTELKRLQRQLGITTIYVTHDQAEALDMSDKIAVINQGRVVQLDTPEAIYFRPENAFVADFVGTTNLLSGKVAKACPKGGSAKVRLANGQVIDCTSLRDVAEGDAATISVRPESIVVVGGSGGDPGNRINAKVKLRGFVGNLARYELTADDMKFSVNTNPKVQLRPGDNVVLSFSPDDAIVLADN